VVTGLAAAAGVAAAGGLATGAAVNLLICSALGAGAAGAIAALVLFRMRKAPIMLQVAVAALAPVLAVAIGVTWATYDMFLMDHDLWVLWVVLIGAGAVGMVIALLLGRRVAAASRSVGEIAKRLGEPETASPAQRSEAGRRQGRPGEFNTLAQELQVTSARLTEVRNRAEAIERSRRNLVAGVSHDLRTPLAGIRAMIEALEDGVVTEPSTVRRYYRTIRLEADRLAGLVDDLFELSRIQSGALRLEVETVALDELIADAIAGASPAARSKAIELRSCGPVPRPWSSWPRPRC
jgi:signal transduction histidine kinase